MHLPDLALLRLQVDALFTHDPDGRIRWTNEPGETPAPRFFLGRTREGNLWRFRYDVPPDAERGLETLLAEEPVTDDLRREPVHLEAYRALLREHTPIPCEESGPAYYFPPEIEAPSNAILITPANVEHVLPEMRTPDDDPFGIKNGLDAGSPCAVVVEGGQGREHLLLLADNRARVRGGRRNAAAVPRQGLRERRRGPVGAGRARQRAHSAVQHVVG